ncbi:MAG: metalloregulator ArsR/SmtB family transcription factor [Clostridia bacterium]
MGCVHAKNAKVFKAFCDEKRLAILELLRSGEKCACVLIDEMDIGQSSVSYHMKILCESGVVDSRQEGKWTHYRLSESGSKYAAALLILLTTPNPTPNPDRCGNLKSPPTDGLF